MSPDERLALVPKSPDENGRFRADLITACLSDPLLAKGCVEACRLDILFWVNVFVIQVDPKRKGESGLPSPFITYPFQDRALPRMNECVERGKDLLIEKSRQMGASWMLIMLFVWRWLFHPWQTFLFISRNEAAVESADPNSLFWKIDFILRHLPSWMKPTNFRRRKRFFGNDDLNSFIFGEASTGSANVGGNTTAMGIDEFSQIKEGYEVLHRTSDATQCRIFNSTHLGLDTAFYELSKRVDMDKLVLHWSEHPLYAAGTYRSEGRKVVPLDRRYEYPADFQFVMDGSPTGGPFPGLRSPWYDAQCKRKGSPRAIAMDLDINPSGSVAQFFDALQIRELQGRYGREPLFTGDFEYDRDLGRPTRFTGRPCLCRDACRCGALRLWLQLKGDGTIPPAPYAIGCDSSTGQGATPSVLSIVNRETGMKVGEWVSNEVEPTPLAAMAVALCWAFKSADGQGAKLAWETPGPGLAFGKRVVALGYRNIYYRTSIDILNPLPTDIPGWPSSPKEKRQLLEEYRAALYARQFLNLSWWALDECLAFRYTSTGLVEHSGERSRNSPADAGYNHGDRVIADALAWRLSQGTKRQAEEEPPESRHPGSLSGRRAMYEAELRRAQEEWA